MENKDDVNEENEIEVNNGAGKSNFSRKDNKNKFVPACDITPVTAEEHSEDELMHFIYTDTATLNKWRQLDPKGVIPPHQWHDVLVYGKNRFQKKRGVSYEKTESGTI
jgi:hypothetical protein